MPTLTLEEFKADLERETLEPGQSLSLSAARTLHSQYLDQEAEAVAGGKYDIIPFEEPKRYHSESCWEALQCGSDCICGLSDPCYYPDAEEIAELEEQQRIADSTAGAFSYWTPKVLVGGALDDDIPF